MVNQGIVAFWLACVQGLLQRIELRKSVRMELLTLQPTMLLGKTSMTKATYCQPCQVATQVKSDTHS